ncbi:MAG: TPM domain-containing protein [bacterium]
MKIRTLGLILTTILFLSITNSFAQDSEFPERPSSPRIVNDFEDILSSTEEQRLEEKLVQFNRETSTQIAVVSLNDLRGYDISDYAVRLAHEWGVGQEDKDNGILILVSPENREVFIATGYGLEGAVPDATAKQIVDNEILPHFRNDNYYEGLDEATTVLLDLTKGEYTAENYMERSGGGESKAPYPIGIVFLLVIIISVIGRVKRARHYSMGHGIPFWVALTMLGSASHRQRGGFNNFSSGSGSFGGSGGGFGGFGGGGFGGGGAGGSW